jgi:hypothetical protein
VAADLVVDASGRTSRTPEWLGRRGYPVPDEEVRRVDKNSVTRVFRTDPARRRRRPSPWPRDRVSRGAA